MICDGTMAGAPLPAALRILAACNPYRLKPAAMNRGGGLARAQAIGRSDLVYVVKPLPETLLDYVWDYGVAARGRVVTSQCRRLPPIRDAPYTTVVSQSGGAA
jgi:hypothetical protein